MKIPFVVKTVGGRPAIHFPNLNDQDLVKVVARRIRQWHGAVHRTEIPDIEHPLSKLMIFEGANAQTMVDNFRNDEDFEERGHGA